MHFRSLFLLSLSLMVALPTAWEPLSALPISEEESCTEFYEGKSVCSINLSIENAPPSTNTTAEVRSLKERLSTHAGAPFSHDTFDRDLKKLGERFERVVPEIRVTSCGELEISIALWQAPLLAKVRIEGNFCISTSKIADILDLKEGKPFDREEFFKAFAKLRDHYVKEGFFEARLGYRILPNIDQSQVALDILIQEGRRGFIHAIKFEGLSSSEEGKLSEMITTRKHNLLSWLVGGGTYDEEAINRDKETILAFLHDLGYADASVEIELVDAPDGCIDLLIRVEKGDVYHFGSISFKGNTEVENATIIRALPLHPGDTYSPSLLRRAVTSIQDVYGDRGYIETRVIYQLRLQESSPTYDVEFKIQESSLCKIGLVRIVGNHATSSRLILQHAKICPGDIIEQSRLKACEESLIGTGLFKDVKVYATRGSLSHELGPEYRDIVIEVEEQTTAHAGFFWGFSTTESALGGLDLTENNFNYRGLWKCWRRGMRSLRGAGEFLNIKVQAGPKQQSYTLSWLTPYWNETLWRFGIDANYSRSSTVSDDYDFGTFGLGFYGSYPISSIWSAGWKYRFKNTIIDISNAAGKAAEEQHGNSGIVTGAALFLQLDSTNSNYKPRYGVRSSAEAEIAGVIRHAHDPHSFPFAKATWQNTAYYPVWSRGTLKARGDFRFLFPIHPGVPNYIPMSERFFLGGENSVRGYKPAIIGPKFPNPEAGTDPQPTGGMSSVLFSVEYVQNILKPIDIFCFVDSGAISQSLFKMGALRWSVGYGARLEIAGRVPFTIGMGYPLNAENKSDVEHLFFMMGGQF